jgi:hypothetical protein
MSAHGSSAIGWFGRLLIVFAIAVLSALTFSYFDRPAQEPAKPFSRDVQFSQRPQAAAISTSGAPRMDGAINRQGAWRAAEPAYLFPSSRPPSAPSFKFLGKLTEGDETLVLLYRGGQTLVVRRLGPLDDDNPDYVVDALEEAYLVLRHISLGETQIIQLASQEPTIETGWSAENTPQD